MSLLDSHIAEMNDYILRLPIDVKDNILIKKANTDYPYALHLSKDKTITKMIPMIGHRQAKSEDRTVPRICVADTLIDCMRGYAAIWDDITDNTPHVTGNGDSIKDTNAFKGGYYLYRIPYVVALKPNKELVYDCEITNEFWLVNYQKDQGEYLPELFVSLFVKKIEREYLSFNTTRHTYHFYLNTKDYLPIFFDKEKNIRDTVKKGCYQLTITLDITNKTQIEKNYSYHIVPIPEKDYTIMKNHTVSLLSYTPTPSALW